MRLTKDVRQKLLEQNEGFQRTTYYESNNSYNTNTYTISNGQLTVQRGIPAGRIASMTRHAFVTVLRRTAF